MANLYTNDILCDELVQSGSVSDGPVLKAFRNTDRGDFVEPNTPRHSIYEVRALKTSAVHLSSPSMYATVLKALEFRKGLSFLNVGSGSGYLSCLVLDIVGFTGLSHGIDVDGKVVEHSRLCCAKWIDKSVEKLKQELESSINEALLQQNVAMLHESISFVHGNCFHIDWTEQPKYDRIYVGAGCPDSHKEFFYNLLAVGGILVIPVIDNGLLVKVRRLSECVFSTENVGMCRYASLQKTDGVMGNLRFDKQTSDALKIINQLRAVTPDLSSEVNANSQIRTTSLLAPQLPDESTSPMTRRVELISCESTNSVTVSRLPVSVWAPNTHHHQQFPASFRKAAVTLLMCASQHTEAAPVRRARDAASRSSHRVVAGYQSVPSHVWFHVLSFCHRDWFVPPVSATELLLQELMVERRLRLLAEERLEKALQQQKSAGVLSWMLSDEEEEEDDDDE